MPETAVITATAKAAERVAELPLDETSFKLLADILENEQAGSRESACEITAFDDLLKRDRGFVHTENTVNGLTVVREDVHLGAVPDARRTTVREARLTRLHVSGGELAIAHGFRVAQYTGTDAKLAVEKMWPITSQVGRGIRFRPVAQMILAIHELRTLRMANNQ